MKETLRFVDQMIRDGVIEEYAIGGAVGATFYMEPMATMDVDDVTTRVMTAEHLVAIALQLGRAKDFARILQFVEMGCLNDTRLREILTRHGLTDAWRQFQRRFLEDSP
jgi:hypothetical protein